MAFQTHKEGPINTYDGDYQVRVWELYRMFGDFVRARNEMFIWDKYHPELHLPPGDKYITKQILKTVDP